MADERSNGDPLAHLMDDAVNAINEEHYKELLGPLFDDGGVISINKCPKCGSNLRIMKLMYDYLTSMGKMKSGLTAYSSVDVQVFYNSTGMQLIGSKAVTLKICRDVCRQCGTEYPVRIERVDTVLESMEIRGRK